MKNMFKAMICAFTIAAAALTVPAMVSARDNRDLYVADSYALILRDQADEDSDIVFYADGDGYELYVQDYLNGFGFCYVPAFEVNGWVDLSETYYVGELDDDEYVNDLDDDEYEYDVYDDDEEYDEVLHSYVDYGFLALRYAPAANDSNIIAEIYNNGTKLYMTGEYVGNYGYCYVPALEMYGWVDVRYTY